MATIENLKPFKKGFDPRRKINPRPKGSVSITKLIRQGLREIGDGETESYEILLKKKILKKAVKDGNEKIIQLVWDHIDGKPKDPDLSDKMKSAVAILLGLNKHESESDDAETD